MRLQAGSLAIGEGVPKICVPVTGVTREEILAQASGAVDAGADLVEWRADFYEQAEDVEAVTGTLDALSGRLGEVPVLFTFRTKGEGGERKIATKDYERLLLAAASPGKAPIIDVEVRRPGLDFRRFVEEAHKRNALVLASSHHFEETPSVAEMMGILSGMEALRADILKLAVMPKTPEDVLDLLQVTRRISTRTQCPVVTMSMGKMGVISRISGKITGSAITFATIKKASAPGQIPIEEMRSILRILT